MGALLELIFNNLFFVIIIASAIISFFKKSVTETTKPIERPKPVQKQMPRQFHVDQEKYEKMTEFEKRNTALKEQEELLTPPKREEPRMESVIGIPKTTRKKREAKSFLVTKNSVVKGIIWSKILDEPRSKKPYKYRNLKG